MGSRTLNRKSQTKQLYARMSKCRDLSVCISLTIQLSFCVCVFLLISTSLPIQLSISLSVYLAACISKNISLCLYLPIYLASNIHNNYIHNPRTAKDTEIGCHTLCHEPETSVDARRSPPTEPPERPGRRGLLKGSWDLVTRVINKVTILIITYNPNQGTYNLTY